MSNKFELLIKDLWQALEHPGKDRSVMGMAVYGLRRFFPELARDAVKLRQVLPLLTTSPPTAPAKRWNGAPVDENVM